MQIAQTSEDQRELQKKKEKLAAVQARLDAEQTQIEKSRAQHTLDQMNLRDSEKSLSEMKRQLTKREAAVYEEMNKRLQIFVQKTANWKRIKRLIKESEKKLRETLNQVKENVAKIEGALNPYQNDGQNDAENAQEDRLVEPRPKKGFLRRGIPTNNNNGANKERNGQIPNIEDAAPIQNLGNQDNDGGEMEM